VQRRNFLRRVGLTARGSAIVCLLACVAGAGAHARADGAPVAVPAPDFALKATDGRNLRLSEYRGAPLVLSFWASGCGECRTVLGELARIQAPAESVLGVSLDSDARRAASVAGSLDLTFPNVVDTRQAVARQYDVETLPYTLLIDAQGAVRTRWAGKPPSAAELERRLAELRQE
jgi:peroxiredoxin